MKWLATLARDGDHYFVLIWQHGDERRAQGRLLRWHVEGMLQSEPMTRSIHRELDLLHHEEHPTKITPLGSVEAARRRAWDAKEAIDAYLDNN